jgi:diguanylate cyclase (GGDEF)-like protein
MDCEKVAAMLPALVDGEIPSEECLPLAIHLAGCAACRASEDVLPAQDRVVRPNSPPSSPAEGVQVPTAAVAANGPRPPSTPSRCTLLVVDDEPAVLTAVALLIGADFDVLTAESADAAQAVFARRPVDVLLTDQKMPRRTGVQLLEWVRENSPRTVRLLMSSYAELEDAVEAINRGHVYHYLPKPWRGEELRHVLRNAAEKVHLVRSRDELLGELQRLNRDLERRVAERTRELEDANQLLQQRTRELERLALMDPLTGLFNRRAVDELVRFELKRHARYPSPLSIGLIDVDHFKRVNTDYLHTGGDEVLKGLARLLASSLRAVDSVGRIGGEEFLAIARDTGEDGAAHLAERIRAAVAATPIVYEGRAISVTVSIGVAVAEVGVPATQEAFYETAAQALAEAKRTGRNRVVVRRLASA